MFETFDSWCIIRATELILNTGYYGYFPVDTLRLTRIVTASRGTDTHDQIETLEVDFCLTYYGRVVLDVRRTIHCTPKPTYAPKHTGIAAYTNNGHTAPAAKNTV